MKKKFYVFVALFVQCQCLFAQTYPQSFTWIPGYPITDIPKEDQQEQGPCNIFAAVAGIEDWYQLLYGSNVTMSQQHLYSKCKPTNGPGFTDLTYSMEFLRDTGVVTWAQIPYGNTVTNTTNDPWWANLVTPTSTSYPCLAPNMWNSPSTPPVNLYNLGGYQIPSFSTYLPGVNNITKLKRFLINYGPIILTCTNANWHGGATHAYMLYAWDSTSGQTTWYLKDSWPGTAAYSTFTGDFIGALGHAINVLEGPYIITTGTLANGTKVNGAYSEIKGANGWVPDGKTITGVNITNTFNNLAIQVANPYISGLATTTASIYNISEMDAGFTVKWTYAACKSTPGASVGFGTPNANGSVSVSTSTEGYVQLIAHVARANGLTEVIYSDSIYASPGIPFTIQKVNDLCSGTTRAIKWEVFSKMNILLPSTITVGWTFRPAPGTDVYSYESQSDLKYDVYNIDYYGLTNPTGYGLIASLVDAGYNNITDGATEGTNAMPCGSMGQAITVSPNPARNTLLVGLPVSKGGVRLQYTVELTSVSGQVVMSKTLNGSENLDVSNLARGTYIIRFVPADKSAAAVVQKIVIQ